MRRGQSSVELLMVLVISLTILATLINFTTEHVSNLEKQHAVDAAQDSVNRLVREINSVYLLGPGKVRDVIIPFPSGIDASRSRLENNGIVLSVYGTDVTGTAIPPLQGSVPTSEGLVRIRLISYADHVTISLVSLLSDKDNLYIPMSRDSNATGEITFTNPGTSTATVTFSLSWPHSLVGARAASSLATLPAGSSYTLDFDFNAGGTAQGNYVGYLSVQSISNGNTENFSIPINVEVFAPANTLLTVIPSSISLSTLGADTNYSTIRVCNSGTTEIKSISFTPTASSPGAWITPISTIPTLAGSACQDVNVTITVPSGVTSGSYVGAISVVDFTGANNTIVGVTTNVQTMSDYFIWDWFVDAAILANDGNSLQGFELQNVSTKPITMTQVAIHGWWTCDVNHSSIREIRFNGQIVFSGTAYDGNIMNITDTNISAQTTLSGNKIVFSNDQQSTFAQYLPVVYFSDGSTYTGDVLGDGCLADTTPPGLPTAFTATQGPSSESILLQWVFPGDDNQTGLVSSMDIRYSTSAISTGAQFASATPITYTGNLLQAGNVGEQLVTNLDVGRTYYFSIMFFDDVDNNSGISSSPSSRARNTFKYSLSDMNITPFAYSIYPDVDGMLDVNRFDLNTFVSSSGDRNIYIHVLDDVNTSNNWYVALGFTAARMRSVRIWYPTSNAVGLPGGTPNYTGDPNWGYPISGVDFLSSTIFPTNYRFNGSLVSFPNPTRLKVEFLQGFSDVNLTFDQSGT